MATPALWSFFGLFAGVWKLLVVLATLAVVGWRAGWLHRLGLARRLLAWAQAASPMTSRSGPAMPATSGIRRDWRLVAALFLLAWLAAWVLIPRLMFPRASLRPADPTTAASPAAGSRPPFPGGSP